MKVKNNSIASIQKIVTSSRRLDRADAAHNINDTF